jgi:hypothetical protein
MPYIIEVCEVYSHCMDGHTKPSMKQGGQDINSRLAFIARTLHVKILSLRGPPPTPPPGGGAPKKKKKKKKKII